VRAFGVVLLLKKVGTAFLERKTRNGRGYKPIYGVLEAEKPRAGAFQLLKHKAGTAFFG